MSEINIPGAVLIYCQSRLNGAASILGAAEMGMLRLNSRDISTLIDHLRDVANDLETNVNHLSKGPTP